MYIKWYIPGIKEIKKSQDLKLLRFPESFTIPTERANKTRATRHPSGKNFGTFMEFPRILVVIIEVSQN